MNTEDEDVVLAGSALHTHLVASGFNDLEVGGGVVSHSDKTDFSCDPDDKSGVTESNNWFKQARHFLLPPLDSHDLHQNCVGAVLDSGLLGAEDEQFFEQSLQISSNSSCKRSSALTDTLVLSSCLAGLGQAILNKKGFLAGTLLVGAASLFCWRVGVRMVNSRNESWVISLLTVLIRRMKELKTIMAKSFNLIKGMEMLSKSVTTANLGRQSSAQQLRLKAFQKKSLLIPLRQSVYRSGYQMMLYLR